MLKEYEFNPPDVNRAISKYFHRIAFGLKMPAMCYQASIFLTFQKINANQGKIGGGPVNLLLKIHGLDLVDIQVANKIKNKNQKPAVLKKLKENLKTLLGNEYSEREMLNMQTSMTEKEFIDWIKGFTSGVHHYNVTPKQWDYLKEVLQTVGKTSYVDYSTGNWTMNHSWE